MKKDNITDINEYRSLHNSDMGDNLNNAPDILEEELSEELIQAYLDAADIDTPKLWARVEAGFDREYADMLATGADLNNDYTQTEEAYSKKTDTGKAYRRVIAGKYIGMAAAVILIIILAIPAIMSGFGGRTKSDESLMDSIEYETESDSGYSVEANMEASMESEAGMENSIESNMQTGMKDNMESNMQTGMDDVSADEETIDAADGTAAESVAGDADKTSNSGSTEAEVRDDDASDESFEFVLTFCIGYLRQFIAK